MSIPVALADLAATIRSYDLAFLVTVSPERRPRLLAMRPAVEPGPRLVVSGTGPGTRADAACGAVALLYPNRDPAGHSLIIDGTAQARGEDIVITPSAAVLHAPR